MALLTRGRTTAAVLALLTSTPGQELHTREIVRRTGGTEHPVHRALTLLERQGLVQSRRLGNMRLWTMSSDHPLYGSLRELFARTVGLAEQLRGSLRDQPVELAFIFGSFASSTDDRSSDIDVFVLGEVDWERVRSLTGDALDRFGRELRPIVWSDADLRRAGRARSPFLSTLRAAPKIWVIGDDDEFERRLGEVGSKARRPDPEGRARPVRRAGKTRPRAEERGSRAGKPQGRRS
jgi:polymorphic toxin system nucleotidyltransferase-like protein